MVSRAAPREPRWRTPAATRATIVLLVAIGLLALLLVAVSASSLAADPTASPGELLSGGDSRSEGSGPGLVGSPLGVLLAVVALGLVTALLTIFLARVATRR
jgi:H+/Cl- antiporter ClcA